MSIAPGWGFALAEPLADTWARRELPILREALRRADAGELLTSIEDIRVAVGLDAAHMRTGLDALRFADPPYLEVQYTMSGVASGHVSKVSERARRELGSWPSADTIVDRLVAALAEAEQREADPQQKSRLRAAAETMGGIGRDVLVQVLAKVGGG